VFSIYISNQTGDATNTTDVECVSATFNTYLPGSRTAMCRQPITVVK